MLLDSFSPFGDSLLFVSVGSLGDVLVVVDEEPFPSSSNEALLFFTVVFKSTVTAFELSEAWLEVAP